MEQLAQTKSPYVTSLQGPRPLNQLALIRTCRGHTQKSLSDATKDAGGAVSRRTIQRLEKDRGVPSAETALRLSRALGYGSDIGALFPDLPHNHQERPPGALGGKADDRGQPAEV